MQDFKLIRSILADVTEANGFADFTDKYGYCPEPNTLVYDFDDRFSVVIELTDDSVLVSSYDTEPWDVIISERHVTSIDDFRGLVTETSEILRSR